MTEPDVEETVDLSGYDYVDDEVVAAVRDTELPKRLRREVYETIEERGGAALDRVEELAKAVEQRYLGTRVDPLDPVGTVSAQSIGEPGTQMSVEHDERILLREGEEIRTVAIGPFIDTLLQEQDAVRRFDGHEVALAPAGVEVLSLRRDEGLEWKPVEEISRHEAPEELLRIELESGRTIRATRSHSFVTRTDTGIEPVAGETLETGDELPVVGDYDPGAGRAELRDVTSTPSVSADGGTTASGVDLPSGRTVGRAEWDRITAIEPVEPEHEYVYDVSVAGLETFTTAQGVVTHNTMNTFHYAGVAEIDVTQGLPRLIELVDARKEPDTPMMTVYLEDEYATEREKAREVVWNIEATKILALGDISTNVADMQVRIDLNEETLEERMLSPEAIAETIEAKLGVEAVQEGTVIEFGPERPSYRELLQLVEQLRDIVFKGIEDITRVVIRKEQHEDGEEFVLYTEGSAFGDVIELDGVDPSRTTTNNIHEINKTLGIEAAREAIINETMDTLEEQGLGDVNVRHLMLVADIMTTKGTIESIGRHGISGAKESVLARAAFEVTVNHLLDAATHGEVDDLNGVTENVIVGKPIKLGTGDVDLRMRSSPVTDGGAPDGDADADAGAD